MNIEFHLARLAEIRQRTQDAVARARAAGAADEVEQGAALLAYIDSVEGEIRGAEITLANGLRIIGHASPEQRAFCETLPKKLVDMVEHVGFTRDGLVSVNLRTEDAAEADEFDRGLRLCQELYFANAPHGSA